MWEQALEGRVIEAHHKQLDDFAEQPQQRNRAILLGVPFVALFVQQYYLCLFPHVGENALLQQHSTQIVDFGRLQSPSTIITSLLVEMVTIWPLRSSQLVQLAPRGCFFVVSRRSPSG